MPSKKANKICKESKMTKPENKILSWDNFKNHQQKVQFFKHLILRNHLGSKIKSVGCVCMKFS